MGNQHTYKPLRKVTVRTGQTVVVDEELQCLFIDMGGNQYDYVDSFVGTSGKIAFEERRPLSGFTLDRWTKEGKIRNGEAYKKRLRFAFKA